MTSAMGSGKEGTRRGARDVWATSGGREEGGGSRLELRLIAGKRLGPSYGGGFCAGSRLSAAIAFMRSVPPYSHMRIFHPCIISPEQNNE